MNQIIYNIPHQENFSREDFIVAFERENKNRTKASGRYRFQKLLSNGEIYRVGRNQYRMAEDSKSHYSYHYSVLSLDIAKKIEALYPELDFRIFELVQLNEFVNHQIAHNVIFVFIESELGSYVFDSLKERYIGKILLNPSVETFHQYWSDNMIVIKKLVSESPKGEGAVWETKLEKMLVDLVADKLLLSSVSSGEYDSIFYQAFRDFYIDESQLFRYARRRNAKNKILLHADKTDLRMGL
jgi:hypothetical protein